MFHINIPIVHLFPDPHYHHGSLQGAQYLTLSLQPSLTLILSARQRR